LKLYRHEASRCLFATAQLLVFCPIRAVLHSSLAHVSFAQLLFLNFESTIQSANILVKSSV